MTPAPKRRRTPRADRPEPRRTPRADRPEPRRTPRADRPEPRRTPRADRPEPRRTPRADRPEPRRTPRTEHALGGDQIEGRRAVVELLLAQRRPVRDIWISDALEESEIIAQIVELAQAANVPLRRIGRSRLDAEARTDAPQGVLAHAEPLSEESLDALAAAGHDGGSGPDGGSGVAPFLIVLDQITDPHNVGALLRTAECFGATGVVLGRHRSAHVTPTVAKAAAGAIEWLRFAVVPGIPGALAELARLGVWCVGLDPGAPTTMGDVVVAEGPVALVLGSEDHGLSRLARQRCDVLASIPRSGRIESLNVSAAGAVAMAEMARRRLSA